jgi:glycosyltransferase involved in cell wall biosynthesis
MKILYFSFVELDIPNACQTHTLGVLKGFSENGCSVDAVVPRPIKLKPNISGVRFFYIWPWQFSPLGIVWVKILGAFYFFTLCLWNHYDAIYVRELDINLFPRWCSRIFKIPYYIEVNAAVLYSEDATNAKDRLIISIERNRAADFKQSSGLIVTSFPMSYQLITKYGLNKNKVHTILNGTFPPPKEKIGRTEALSRLGLPLDGFYLGFLGNIWGYYDLNGLLEAMEICLEDIPSLHLITIGGGPKTESFKQQASEMGLLKHLTFLGHIQPDALFHVMGAMDVGLINLTKEGLRSGGPIPTRFATYAAFGVPVIVNDYMMEDYPDDLLRGLSLVPPEDSRALANVISWHYHHPKEIRENGQILRDYVLKKMTWNHVADEILKVMRHCVPPQSF